jgi:hypothetical protein
MIRRTTLLTDAFINLVLTVLLLCFSPDLADFLGVPAVQNNFYPNILGAVFLGITIALIIEAYRNPAEIQKTGLGLAGAVSINMCGGIVLFIWLVAGDLAIPFKGKLFLWILDLVLLMISTVEIIHIWKRDRN